MFYDRTPSRAWDKMEMIGKLAEATGKLALVINRMDPDDPDFQALAGIIEDLCGLADRLE